MNRHTIISIIVFLLIGLLLTTVVLAAARDVTQDTIWQGNAAPTTINGSTNPLVVEGGQAGCDPTQVPLLKWNLSDIPSGSIVGGATLTIPNVNVALNTANATLSIFEAPDTWDETTPQSGLPTPPAPGSTALATLPAGSVVQGQPIVFIASGANDPLIKYIQTQIDGDDTASFWVEFGSGCPNGGTAIFSFNSREGGTATLKLTSSTSVGLATFSANDSSMNWPMIAGLFALAAVVVVGIGYGVRRFKQS